MLAAVAVSQDPADPLAGLRLLDLPEPVAPDGWVRVEVRAAALNPHDLWTLRGVGHPAERLPMTLGCDAAGVDENGEEVIVHPVIGDPDAGGGDETLDPGRALLSERHHGAFARYVVVPARNVVRKPAHLSFEEAACLPVAWSTAYRMLFTQARIRAGDRVLVQGAGGGVASAAIAMAAAAGAVVHATSRSEVKREAALALGAASAVPTGQRLPEPVDVVVETVGAATWEHSLRALRPGGTVVVAGATTGAMPPADLTRIFYRQLRVLGSTGATRGELERMLRFLTATGIRPTVDAVLPLTEIHAAFGRLIAGDVVGKVVVTP